MYRHFAVVTLVLTAAVALIADGESRDAAGDHADGTDQPVSDTPWSHRSAEEEAKLRQREPIQPYVANGFKEIEGGYGQPTVPIRGPDINTSIYSNADDWSDRQAIPGYPQAYINGLSEAEYRKLLEGLREAGMTDPRLRASRIAAIERASAARSGAAARSE